MLETRLEDGVLHVQLHRPPVNAFNRDLFLSLEQTIDSASEDPDVRCIVLSSGLPGVFTAGLDLNSPVLPATASGSDPARVAFLMRGVIKSLQHSIASVERCRVPVIASLHGLVIGAGVDLVSACDIRLASSSTKFSIKEVDVGLAADVGTLQRFPKVCGNDSKARELVYTARNFDAQEALDIGFLSQIVKGGPDEVLRQSFKLAKVIASKSPVAVASSKAILNHARDHPVAESLDFTATWNMAMLQAKDLPDSIAAVLAKKVPTYQPLAKL